MKVQPKVKCLFSLEIPGLNYTAKFICFRCNNGLGLFVLFLFLNHTQTGVGGIHGI